MKLSTVVCQCHHGYCHHPGAGENASPQLLDLDPQLSRICVRVAEALMQAVGVIWVGGHLLGLAQVQWLRLSEVVIDVKSRERVLCPPGCTACCGKQDGGGRLQLSAQTKKPPWLRSWHLPLQPPPRSHVSVCAVRPATWHLAHHAFPAPRQSPPPKRRLPELAYV